MIMNQATLGALRGIGYLVLFAVLTTLIGLIPDVLTQLPGVGAFVTPAIATAITMAAAAYEHTLAVSVGYNLPASTPTN